MDWQKVYGLLHIAELSNKWPHLRELHNAAMRELGEHSKEAAGANADAKKVEDEAAAKEKDDALAQAKAQAEKDQEKPAPESSSIKRRFGADETSEDRKE